MKPPPTGRLRRAESFISRAAPLRTVLLHQTLLHVQDTRARIWSDNIAQEPLVSTEDFEAVQALRLTRRKTSPLEPLQRKQRATERDYLLSRLLYCGLRGRKMESTFNHGRPHYRCRYPAEYAEANGIEHPASIYVREDRIVPHLDKWLAKIFAPHRIGATAKALADASTGDDDHAILADAAKRELTAADRKLSQYRALLEAGTDPATVAGWIREVEVEKIAINARLRQLGGRAIMTTEEITAIVHALGDLVKVLGQAAPADKMKIYKELGLRLDYDAKARTVAVEVKTAGSDIESNADGCARKVSVRGRTFSIIREKNYTIAADLPIETDWKLTRDIAERESVDATAIRTWARGQGPVGRCPRPTPIQCYPSLAPGEQITAVVSP